MANDQDRRRHRLEARAAVIAKYGSTEAALAPCPRETLIIAAVAPWRKTLPPPDDRWTARLDGWQGDCSGAPPSHVVAAITAAYGLPATFRAALQEAKYWQARNEEINLVLDEEGTSGDADCLDLASGVRAAEVRKLLDHGLPASSIEDVSLRFRIFRQRGYADDAVADALLRDLAALADRGRQTPTALTTRDDLAGSISAALDADPSRSDRDVARACGCSPSTVGKVRRGMGLDRGARTVRRGEQAYELRIKPGL